MPERSTGRIAMRTTGRAHGCAAHASAVHCAIISSPICAEGAAMPVTRAFAAVNGTRLAYEVAGAGPPIVLLHGLTVDMRMWDDQFAPFAAQHRVVRYDLRGFGQSDPPREGEPYTHG